MAYDLEEQEQIDELKAWWKQNGKMISTLVIGVLLAYSAYQGWHYFQNKQAVEASTEYQERFGGFLNIDRSLICSPVAVHPSAYCYPVKIPIRQKCRYLVRAYLLIYQV